MKCDVEIKRFDSYLDRLVRPDIHIAQLSRSTFQVFGYSGLALAVVLAMSLVLQLGLSPLIMAGVIIAAVATFFALAMATKIVIGEERLIYYHHEIAIVLVAALLLWLLDRPVLPYLDMTVLGIGTFLTFGRIGCLMVGCCHGRPHRFGVCYGEAHAHAGFTPHYVGVRLFPIQAVESVWVLGTVLVGIAMVLLDFPAGAAMAWYIIVYDIGRFFFEFIRGDADRHYWKEFSEGQWTSVLLMVIVVALERSGRIPYESWHLGATVALLLTMVAVTVRRRFQKTPKYRLLNPCYVREIAQALDRTPGREFQTTAPGLSGSKAPLIAVQDTSAGIRISASRHLQDGCPVHHVALSCRDGHLTREVAQTVAEVIQTIKWPLCIMNLLEGEKGAYHLLFKERSSGETILQGEEFRGHNT